MSDDWKTYPFELIFTSPLVIEPKATITLTRELEQDRVFKGNLFVIPDELAEKVVVESITIERVNHLIGPDATPGMLFHYSHTMMNPMYIQFDIVQPGGHLEIKLRNVSSGPVRGGLLLRKSFRDGLCYREGVRDAWAALIGNSREATCKEREGA